MSGKTTPMMAQWQTCKEQAKGALLLFRMGDFYEAFYDDAEALARDLDLTLTQRQGIPMAGVPHHASQNYIDRLINAGHRVAIAEQTEDPKQAKGLVKREVVRVVTPGTVIESSLLADKRNNFFVALAQIGSIFGIASLDLTTAQFRVMEVESKRELLNELYRLHASEYLVGNRFSERHADLFAELRRHSNPLVNELEEWQFDHQVAYQALVHHFRVQSLDSFGLKGMVAAINAAGALLRHLTEELHLPLSQLREIGPMAREESVAIDRITQRNLELTEPLGDGGRSHTLLGCIDRTRTPMGGRLLRHWLLRPLLKPEAIEARQEGVAALLNHPFALTGLSQRLSRVRDLERLTTKISTGFASPRDLVALALSLEELPGIQSILSEVERAQLLAEPLRDLSEVASAIRNALVDEPPVRASDGGLFRDGHHAKLDELRSLTRDGKQWIAEYQNRIREETSIKTLKIGFHKVFGYFIEASKGQAHLVPESFQRRQTLANCERFISPELKEYEQKVLSAEEQLFALELDLFNKLRSEVASHAERILATAKRLAVIDVLHSFATSAREGRQVRPVVDRSDRLEIIGGRHPIIEQVDQATTFVPNDTELNEEERIFLITGPNMAGKSTYIRQVALIALLAQIGAFVPAESAHIGVIDKIFTRIGASDDLSRGQSTFMVEMTETANILHNATDRSLVILDEIGRGTSTFDGLSIAQSVVEYLATEEGKRAKTLFATHYGELTQLEGSLPGVVNYSVSVREWEEEIVFLHKIIRGGTDRSYGIHVARLAGLPRSVVERAKGILHQLEGAAPTKSKKPKEQATQLLLFDV